jgi:hypothetical protein
MKDITDFIGCSTVGAVLTADEQKQLATTSEYFLLKTKTTVGDAKKITYSIIFRDLTSGKTEIISRTQRSL